MRPKTKSSHAVPRLAFLFALAWLVFSTPSQTPPANIQLHPLQRQSAAFIAPMTNAVADTNITQFAHWLRQEVRNLSNANNQTNAGQSEMLVGSKGTPSIIRAADRIGRRSVAVQPDEATRDTKVRDFMRNHRAPLQLENADAEIEIRQRHQDEQGKFHYRLQQRFHGLKIWGGEASVHLADDGSVDVMEGALIPTPKISTTPQIAFAAASDFINRQFFAGGGNIFDQPELVIDSAPGAMPRLAWKFSMASDVFDARRFLVDALNGEVFRVINLVHDEAVTGTGFDALGQQRSLNLWHSGSFYYLVDTSKPMFQSNSAPPALNSTFGGITIMDARNQPATSSPTGIPALYFSSSASAFSGWTPDAISAAYGLAKVYDYFYAVHGRNSFDNHGSSLVGNVRLGLNFQNAYWNAQFKQMFYGDGMSRSVDVCGHEVTHGVINSIGDAGILEYANQSGALNEAFADIFGEMVEAYARGSNDWLVGSDLNSPFRNFANPVVYGQPGKMSQYVHTANDHGGVHINSGIITHAFYLLAAGLPNAIGINDAQRIFYRAMTLHLLLHSQFIDARHACVQSAEELFGAGSNQALKTTEAFDAVEILDAPPTAFPGAIAAVNAPDSTICLAYRVGYGYYLVRREAVLGDDSSSGKAIPNTGYLNSERVSVRGDGQVAAFVTDDFDFGAFRTDGTKVAFGNHPGLFYSAAMSPDGSLAAVVALDSFGYPNNQIYIVNLVSDVDPLAYTLYGVTSEGNYIDVVSNADLMDFTSDGRFLVYDAYCYLETASGEIVDGWTIFALDVATGSIQTLLDLNTDYDIGSPALGNTHGNLIAFDITDKNTGVSTIMAGDLVTGVYKAIDTTTGLGSPSFNGDDTALVYSRTDMTRPTHSSLYRRPLSGDGITPKSPAVLWFVNADAGVIYRRGVFTGVNVAPTATLTYPAPNQILGAPTNVTLRANATDSDGKIGKIEFYVDSKKIGSDSTAPFTMVWTNATEGAHRITVRAIDTLGAAGDSANTPVTVVTVPRFTTQPQSRSIGVGTNLTFTASATGTPPLFYQWRKNGLPIIGQTNSTFNIPGVRTTDAAAYSLVVSNKASAITSTNATLTVLIPPSISKQSTNQTIIRNANVTLSVTAAGSAPLRYQWLSNGFNILKATNATFAITKAQTNSAATYSVIVTNAAGSITSSNVTVKVLVPPTITLQPVGKSVLIGTNFTFTVSADGTQPLAYQWRKNAVKIPGATNSAFSLPSVVATNAGAYSVVITNIAGTATSASAVLTVRAK